MNRPAFPRWNGVILVAVATALQVVAQPVSAAGISLVPSSLELKGKGGQGTQQRMTITNDTAETMTFELSVQDVTTRGGRRVFVPAGELPGSIAATAVLTPPRLVVGAGETGSANITLTMPMETEVRAIVARFQPIDSHAAPGRVGISLGVGCLLTFTMTDAFEATGEALVVQAPTATRSLTFSQWVTNSGREPFIAKGVVAILDGSQRLVTKIEVRRTRLLPGERLLFTAEEPGEIPVGRYRAVMTLVYGGRVLSKSADWISK